MGRAQKVVVMTLWVLYLVYDRSESNEVLVVWIVVKGGQESIGTQRTSTPAVV